MTPFEAAINVYATEPCVRTFSEDLEAHFRHGYVFNTPDYFYMARPVHKGANHHDIVNPYVTYPDHLCDCWHVYLFAGDMTALFAQAPRKFKWASFERHNRLRYYRWDNIEKSFDKLVK